MQMEKSSLRETINNAIRYWEPRRIVYNIILAAVFVGWIVLTWPHFREASIPQALLFLVLRHTDITG